MKWISWGKGAVQIYFNNVLQDKKIYFDNLDDTNGSYYNLY